MDIETLRMRRVASRISGQLLSARAGIDRSKLSNFERGIIAPNQADLERLERALIELEKAKKTVAAAAARVGLPVHGY